MGNFSSLPCFSVREDKYPSGAFTFASGLTDCCTSNPESYKVIAELPNFRLVEMKVKAGGQDSPQ